MFRATARGHMEGEMKYTALAGRQLFSIISSSHPASISPRRGAAAAGHHVPWPHVLVPLAGVMALAGGLSVLLGFHTRTGRGCW
jgi:uncharacterized membrane protein YphA (DoxX/SURF4 family)